MSFEDLVFYSVATGLEEFRQQQIDKRKEKKRKLEEVTERTI